MPFARNHVVRNPDLSHGRLVLDTGFLGLPLSLRPMRNKPSRASPNEIRITSSVAKLNPVRLELGAGPADGSVNFTIPWPNELFSRFVSPCTGKARAESSDVDAGYPAVFHTRSTMLVEKGLMLRLSAARILVSLAISCSRTVSTKAPYFARVTFTCSRSLYLPAAVAFRSRISTA